MPLLRRSCLVLPTIVLAALVAWLSIVVTRDSEPAAIDWVLCALFVVTMAWEGFVICQVAIGFGAWLRGRAALSPLERRAREIEPVPTGRSRTAIVVPIFDEEVAAVFAGIAVTRRSLVALGRTDDIDIHILSDTREPRTASEEERALEEARDEAGPAILYRRRTDNAGRKAGNIAEFLRRMRGTYDFMVVLDADSLMSGVTVRKLIRLMEEHAEIGLIQTISYAANRLTLFARIQQFAVRLHAPLSLKGMAQWQGADGLYYGHNAIVRCEPFLQHAELPVLPGRPPLGGEILCHDVVEAALLRRGGWEVRVLPDLDGTWEEMPTNVVDLLGRERRWCQGNLQHMRVFGLAGLTVGSRAHIVLGIGGYLMAPLWWAFLLLGAARALAAPTGSGLGVLAYGATEHGSAAVALLWLGGAYILLARVMNVARGLGGRRERVGFGGAARLLASAALEQVFSVLLIPTLSLINAGFVIQTFCGKVVPWDAQSRADRAIGWGEALRLSRVHVLLGFGLAAVSALAGGWYAVWMAPTVLGLLVAPALIAWSSRLDLGIATREWGLFLTEDETDPAEELVALRVTRTDESDAERRSRHGPARSGATSSTTTVAVSCQRSREYQGGA